MPAGRCGYRSAGGFMAVVVDVTSGIVSWFNIYIRRDVFCKFLLVHLINTS